LGQVRQDAPLTELQRPDGARPDGALRPGASRRRVRKRARQPAPGDPRNIGWLYILPGLAFYVLFTLAPLLHTVYYSLFSWDGLTAKTYVGLANYTVAVRDAALRSSFVHSAVLILFYAAIPVVVGLLLTAALTRHPVRGFRFFRTALFLPQLIAGVVIAQAWTWIYDDNGPLNWALREVGLGSLARPWLGDFSWALPSIGAIGTWVTYGLCMVLFVSGVQKIPSTLYDAVRVDGAGAVREFFAVTLPGLRGEVLVAFVLTTINALRSFDIVYNTTAGGPGGSTLVPSMYMYQNAFLYNKVGYAAAVATVLAVTIFVLAAIVLRVGDRGERA
jgi:raffinose/stachyose/melibiose transport system permease protein